MGEPLHAFIANIYSDSGKGQAEVLDAISGVDKHVRAFEPWASIYYWYIPEDPNDGAVYGLEEYETVKHHVDGHNTSAPFKTLVETIGRASSRKNKLSLENLYRVSGFTERSESEPAEIVRVERFTMTSNTDHDKAKPALDSLASYVKNYEPETLSFQAFTSRNNESTLILFSRFKNDTSLHDVHLRSSHKEAADKALKEICISKETKTYKEAGIGFMKRHT